MALQTHRDAVERIAIVGILWVIANFCSSGGQAESSFSFAISSRRNSTGHRLVTASFNIPESSYPKSSNEEDTRIHVEQNINTVENRRIVQLITSFIVLDSGVAPPGYQQVPGLNSYRMHLEPLTWEEARLACEAEGAHLAVLNSQKEADALKGIFAKAPVNVPGASWSHDGWIGFSDLQDGRYLTIFGETLTEAGYSTWLPGEPNNSAHHCGGVSKSQGKLSDLPCEAKLVYFCELES